MFHWLVNEQTEEPGWLKILIILSIGGTNRFEENIVTVCIVMKEYQKAII